MWKEQKTPTVFVILVGFANNCLSFQLHLKINIGYIIQVFFFPTSSHHYLSVVAITGNFWI